MGVMGPRSLTRDRRLADVSPAGQVMGEQIPNAAGALPRSSSTSEHLLRTDEQANTRSINQYFLSTPEQNTVRFLNAHCRRIPAIKPRAIHESNELSIPSKYLSDYQGLVTLIQSGGDLKP